MAKSKPERNFVFAVNPETGSRYAGRGYFKESGDFKLTHMMELAESGGLSDEWYDQLQGYECLYAIDTNYKIINGVKFCVTCAVHISLEYLGSKKWNAHYRRLDAVVFISESENPELEAWVRLIQAIPLEKISGLTGIIVDSNGNLLEKYNTRKSPVVDDYKLPEQVKLIYASSERDLGHPLNKAINVCDSDAKRICNLIETKGVLDKYIQMIKSSSSSIVVLSPNNPRRNKP